MATRTKRQHLSAQSYLRRFANAKDQITVHDKRTGTEYTPNIINVEVEKDFYTVPGPDGEPSDVVEKFIASEIEGPAVDAFDRLTADQFPPTEDDRFIIADFIALQICRGRAFREMHDRSAQHLSGRDISPHIELTPEENARLQREAGPAFLALATSQQFRMEAMLQMAQKAVPLLLERPWVLVRTADAPTGDLPVIGWHQETKTAGFSVGLSVATEISMSISPERVLVLGPLTGSPHANTIIDAPDRWRQQFPQFVANAAQRYVYRRPGTPDPSAA